MMVLCMCRFSNKVYFDLFYIEMIAKEFLGHDLQIPQLCERLFFEINFIY